MIDRMFEERVIRWAIASRSGGRKRQKSATQAFCDSLKYYYKKIDDEPVVSSREEGRANDRKIDWQDVALLNRAYQDPRFPSVHREIVRLRYCYGVSPKKIERECRLARFSFDSQLCAALSIFARLVADVERKSSGCKLRV